jgi:putative flavoprotein involved in K+ transport
MSKDELVRYLESYADSFSAPVREEMMVLAVRLHGEAYRVVTNQGPWTAKNVVIATGYCDVPQVPHFAGQLTRDVEQMVPTRYRRPDSLPPGGVLVVGASATGIQLADELQRSGRQVTLAVGSHFRLPRIYRGRDIMDWLDILGILDERVDDVADPQRARHQPSLQLVGRADRQTLDLQRLQRQGVRLVGRVDGARGGVVRLRRDLAACIEHADRRLERLLCRIDEYVERHGLAQVIPPAIRLAPVSVPDVPGELDLRARGIRSVLWATGFGRSYPWLQVPVLDSSGELIHRGGITASPGLYALGLNFMRRRKSTYIDGVGEDAREIAAHLAARHRWGAHRLSA